MNKNIQEKDMTEKKWSRRDVLKSTGALSAATMVPGFDALTATTKTAKAASQSILKPGQILGAKDAPHTDGDFYDNLFTQIGI